MPRTPTPQRALLGLRSLCASGWRAELLIPALLEALHELIPSARNLFDWTDKEGRLVRYFIEGPVNTEIAQLYFERFHNRDEAQHMPVFNSLREAAIGVRGAGELDQPQFLTSALYNEIWRPQGFRTRIEGVVRSREGQLLGSLVLYRGPNDPPFSAKDETTLAQVLPLLAGALERAAQIDSTPHEKFVFGPEAPETLLLDTQGQLVHATQGAARLMMLADDGLSETTLQRSVQERTQRLFSKLIAQLSARALQERATVLAQPWPSLSVLNAYGRFDAHGSILWPNAVSRGAPAAAPASHNPLPMLQIAIRRLELRDVALHRILRSLPISAGQASVCLSLYTGRTQTDIAKAMGVAPSTVVDQTRKLYQTLDVRGSAQLRDYLDRRLGAVA